MDVGDLSVVVETAFKGRSYKPADVDLGGLERHEGGIIYPRWARTVKNASLYTADGIKCWWGDLGKHQVRTHLTGKGTFYVLTEYDGFWNHKVIDLGFSTRVMATGVDTLNPGLDYVTSRAIAVIKNGRWYWTNTASGKIRNRRERNAKLMWQRRGYPPVTCGCEFTYRDVHDEIVALRQYFARCVATKRHSLISSPVAHRLERIIDFAEAALAADTGGRRLPEIHTLNAAIRRYLDYPDDCTPIESELCVLETHFHDDGLLLDWRLADRSITLELPVAR